MSGFEYQGAQSCFHPEAGTANFSEQTSSSVPAMGEQSFGHVGWTVWDPGCAHPEQAALGC